MVAIIEVIGQSVYMLAIRFRFWNGKSKIGKQTCFHIFNWKEKKKKNTVVLFWGKKKKSTRFPFFKFNQSLYLYSTIVHKQTKNKNNNRKREKHSKTKKDQYKNKSTCPFLIPLLLIRVMYAYTPLWIWYNTKSYSYNRIPGHSW